jgi:hypothetical protein
MIILLINNKIEIFIVILSFIFFKFNLSRTERNEFFIMNYSESTTPKNKFFILTYFPAKLLCFPAKLN